MLRGPGDHGYYKELKVRGQSKVGVEYFLPGDLNIILLVTCHLLSFFSVYQELIFGILKIFKNFLCFGGILSVSIQMSQKIKIAAFVI